MIEFEYAPGRELLDVPLIFIALSHDAGKAGGPAILDTGFDGGVYPNSFLYDLLKDLESIDEEVLKDVTGTIRCSILELKAEIFHPETDLTKVLGNVRVYLPNKREHLSENVIVGREILNKLDIRLNGKKVSIY